MRRGALKSLLLLVLLTAAGCGRVTVPVDRMLLAIRGPWESPPGSAARFAPATVLSFRSSGEFIEFRCHVIEQPNQVLYISRSHPRIAILGRWERRGWWRVITKRLRVYRIRSTTELPDPLCQEPPLRFRGAGKSLKAQTGEMFEPVDRLVAPDFETYVIRARNSGFSCVPPES